MWHKIPFRSLDEKARALSVNTHTYTSNLIIATTETSTGSLQVLEDPKRLGRQR